MYEELIKTLREGIRCYGCKYEELPECENCYISIEAADAIEELLFLCGKGETSVTKNDKGV